MAFSKPLLLLLLCGCSLARSECVADSRPARPHLVELFSSEGCSSCPPAEKWLRTLHDGADVVALEFHVDYWNDLGWRDRFSDARYTARQNAQARRDGSTSVFTPQVVLDGRNWSGWSRAVNLALPQPGELSMHLAAHVTGGTVRVTTSSSTVHPPGELRTYVALVEDGLVTQVQGGENRGARLLHDHVVRAFAGPLPLADASTDLAIPTDLNRANATVVAFAQDARDGKVAQVVNLPLAQCAQ